MSSIEIFLGSEFPELCFMGRKEGRWCLYGYFPPCLPHLLRYIFSCLPRPHLYVRKNEEKPPTQAIIFASFLLVDLLFTESFFFFFFLLNIWSLFSFPPIGNFCQVFILTLPVTFLWFPFSLSDLWSSSLLSQWTETGIQVHPVLYIL